MLQQSTRIQILATAVVAGSHLLLTNSYFLSETYALGAQIGIGLFAIFALGSADAMQYRDYGPKSDLY